MRDKIAFVLNEQGNLVPIMLTIETRQDTDYILEKEMLFLTDMQFVCTDADVFAKGMSVGYAVKTYDDVRDKKAEVDRINQATMDYMEEKMSEEGGS